MSGAVVVLARDQVASCLEGRSGDVLAAVRSAYEAHAAGATSVPLSAFLAVPSDPSARIVGMPAYLDAGEEVAGVKWSSSFPGNVRVGKDRASSVIVLNSPADGRATTLMEASAVNVHRTGASAALAATALHGEQAPEVVGAIGCGPINLSIVRYLQAVYSPVHRLLVFDVIGERARVFAEQVHTFAPDLTVEAAASAEEVLRAAPLVSIATNTRAPHLTDLSGCPAGATLLHMSVRDILPEEIGRYDNVVDDVDHVLRVNTSLHLLEQRRGHREFIRTTLGEVLRGDAPARRRSGELLVYSQFGLGILDLAVAELVRVTAEKAGLGTLVPGFHAG
ncbi:MULTISPECIES: 2,3-diaminopropionate biosynthesis protein SbnB [unclassified Streptomyces]|uniref:2,3-diaminopropionate biosynthesis protein SbnB n=1 Tax=unclassified Streptomyces TaxID=2593676 RepID=UPI002E2D3D2E|nr:2,3-diaminopropionate biosynthesis protein SbnB [Streptomyces sp. NBC_00223]